MNMQIIRRTFLAAAVAATAIAAMPIASQAADLEKTDVRIAVGGKGLYYYLPLSIAEAKGYFKDEGLNVQVIDFMGGSKSLQAVIGGSADIVSGAFEHTITMQTKGQAMRAFVLQGRAPQLVMAINNKTVPNFKTMADLKGKKVGVSAPGSSSQVFATYCLATGGLGAKDVSFIGVGTGSGAVAAMRSGQIDALAALDPAFTTLQNDGVAKIAIDARVIEQADKLYKGPMVAGCLYAPQAFLDKYPKTVQAITNAMVRANKWIQKATAEDVVKTVPASYLMGNKDVYVTGFLKNRPALSKDGRFPQGAPMVSAKALALINPKVDPAKIDLEKVYTNKYADQANKKYPN